jgi:hypothetical protein
VLNLPQYSFFILISFCRLYFFYQRASGMCSQWHDNELTSFARLQYSVPVYPSMPDILYIIEQNKPVGSLYQLKIADIGVKIRLHDGDLHG